MVIKLHLKQCLTSTLNPFRKVDEVEAELEFRYVTDADLKALQDVTSSYDKATGKAIPMDRRVNIDWWLDTYSKPLNKPTLDGFSMTMQMMIGKTCYSVQEWYW